MLEIDYDKYPCFTEEGGNNGRGKYFKSFPSRKWIETIQSNCWEICDYGQPSLNSRGKSENLRFEKHFVRFRKLNQNSNSNCIPQLLFLNSNNGVSRLELRPELYFPDLDLNVYVEIPEISLNLRHNKVYQDSFDKFNFDIDINLYFDLISKLQSNLLDEIPQTMILDLIKLRWNNNVPKMSDTSFVTSPLNGEHPQNKFNFLVQINYNLLKLSVKTLQSKTKPLKNIFREANLSKSIWYVLNDSNNI